MRIVMVKMCFKEILQLQYCRVFLPAVLFSAFCLLSSSGASAQTPLADLLVSKEGPISAQAGNNFSYTITVINAGPNPAINATLTDTLPGNLTFISLTQNSVVPFNCTTPPVGAGGTVTCTSAIFASGASAQFTLTVNIPGGTALGTTYTNIASVSTDTLDPNEENNSSPATTTVAMPSAASVSVSGRVIAANGRGIRGVIVGLIDEQGQQRTAMTSTFGYYRFADIPAGQSYTIIVSAKRYSFTQPAQLLNLSGDIDGINFTADN